MGHSVLNHSSADSRPLKHFAPLAGLGSVRVAQCRLVITAAAVTAGTFFQISGGGNATQLECLGNVSLDGVLHFVKFFLRVEEFARDGILQQRVAVLFKIGNIRAIEGLAVVLLFVQCVALAHHGFILATRCSVRQKSVNALADGGHFRLRDDGFAKFPRFLFNLGRHNQ